MESNRQFDTGTNPTIEKLQDCLRGEMMAVETYERALSSVDHVGLHHALQEILTSHAHRQDLIRERLGHMGGDVPSSTGLFGTFAKVLQRGADILGDRVAIAALEEGEDRGLAMYEEAVASCDGRTRRFIEKDLLPEQHHTHDLCRQLKDYVTQPS